MEKLVNPIQSKFVPGRHITDNIIVTQDIAHSMGKMTRKNSYMTIKVDLEKAYDRLSWDFIFDTLNDIGIPPRLTTVIIKCLLSAKMQIS